MTILKINEIYDPLILIIKFDDGLSIMNNNITIDLVEINGGNTNPLTFVFQNEGSLSFTYRILKEGP